MGLPGCCRGGGVIFHGGWGFENYLLDGVMVVPRWGWDAPSYFKGF